MSMALLYSLIIYFVGNLLVWFQMNGQFKWDYWKDNIWVVGLMGIPISIAFFYATKLSYDAFDGLIWPGRLIAFGISIILFTFLTWYYLGETMTINTIVSLILAVIIVVLQIW